MVVMLLARSHAAGAALPVAAERRLAVVLGNNFGAQEDVPLRFAERDATRVAQTLRELGSVAPTDLFTLLDADADALRAVFAQIAAHIAGHVGPAVLVFYYSGHAGADGLHLGPSRLAWEELRRQLEASGATLRVALIDACQAGSLATSKGFGLMPAAELAVAPSHGTAVIVAAEALEIAQESLELGGSFFTHFLVSALRGAADSDRDGRVTLSEAHSYTTRLTQQATAAWARVVQHPRYRFDIEGHGDVILTDLRQAVATLRLEGLRGGHVVVTEVGSSLAVVEATLPQGGELTWALPAGRYGVHLRGEHAVHIAEAYLPWGGTVRLVGGDFVAHSYQSVAQKGGRVEVHRHHLDAGVTAQAGALSGMGPMALATAGYGFDVAPFELGARVRVGQKTFAATDTHVESRVAGAGLTLAVQQPRATFDLRAWIFGEVQLWHQRVREEGVRQAWAAAVGAGGGVRVPLRDRLFGEVSVEAQGLLIRGESHGAALRPVAGVGAAVGMLF